MNVGIICVCLPSLRLMLIRTFPHVFNTTYGYNSDQSANSHWSEAKRSRRLLKRTGGVRASAQDEVQLVAMEDHGSGAAAKV